MEVMFGDRKITYPETVFWLRQLPGGTGAFDRRPSFRPRRSGDHAHGCGKIPLLPDPGASIFRHYAGGFAAHFPDEGSGGRPKSGRYPCRLFKQLLNARPVP